jgi:[acyl-carrier-protein] S-malonyltransferase
VRTALIFPGQGSQAIGMGRALAETFVEAADVFAEVDAALGQHLSRLMWDGDAAELTLTENAQPALMAVSVAAARVAAAEAGLDPARAVFVAGHSLGEYSALAVSGALGLADTARLLRIRGRAMQAAVAPGEGAMAALLGIEREGADALAREAAEGEVCEVANDNGGGQVVISGLRSAVERAVALAPARGVRRAVLLPVSAPFHCALMAPAAEAMRDALGAVAMAAPCVPLVANVTARATSDPAVIAAQLVSQVTGTVRWRECMEFMAAEGVERFVELGSGKVLTGLAKRIAPAARALACGAPEDLGALQAS